MPRSNPGRLYRKGVGAVLFDKRGRVLIARRIDTPGEAWQLPQGGLDAGESPRRAVLRELAEEIGTARARIIGESRRWLAYDLPPALAGRAWGGRYRGQKQKWFALRFEGSDADIRLDADKHPEFGAWKWMRLDELPGLIVAFKRPVYRALVVEFRRFAKPAKRSRRRRSPGTFEPGRIAGARSRREAGEIQNPRARQKVRPSRGARRKPKRANRAKPKRPK
ncbi:MAG: RNA pyrophosphohydrolase [Rhodospirillales bacterium]|nr:RNA pyrophosphohydrolase [Rhodospirillales bacterium]